MRIDFKKILKKVKQRQHDNNLDTILSIQYIGNIFKKNSKK